MARLELTLNFPKSFHVKTFNVKSEKKLSPLAKLILQNVQFKHFFDMWIYEIYINKVSTHNKFMSQKFQNLEPGEYITIKLAYGSSVSQEKK